MEITPSLSLKTKTKLIIPDDFKKKHKDCYLFGTDECLEWKEEDEVVKNLDKFVSDHEQE